MRLVAVVLVAACGGGTAAPDADLRPMAAASVRVFDAADYYRDNGQLLVPDLNVHVCVDCPQCTSMTLAGTYRGSGALAPPRVTHVKAACPAGQLEAVVGVTAGDAGENTIAVHGDVAGDGEIEVTLPSDVIAPRTLSAAPGTTFPMCPGEAIALDWLPATDLMPHDGMLRWAKPTFCGYPGGCEGVQPPAFGASTTIDSMIHFVVPTVSAAPSVTMLVAGVITAKVSIEPDAGEARCTAASCMYQFDHWAQLDAGYVPNCL